jgi:hypothetical protein
MIKFINNKIKIFDFAVGIQWVILIILEQKLNEYSCTIDKLIFGCVGVTTLYSFIKIASLLSNKKKYTFITLSFYGLILLISISLIVSNIFYGLSHCNDKPLDRQSKTEVISIIPCTIDTLIPLYPDTLFWKDTITINILDRASHDSKDSTSRVIIVINPIKSINSQFKIIGFEIREILELLPSTSQIRFTDVKNRKNKLTFIFNYIIFEVFGDGIVELIDILLESFPLIGSNRLLEKDLESLIKEISIVNYQCQVFYSLEKEFDNNEIIKYSEKVENLNQEINNHNGSPRSLRRKLRKIKGLIQKVYYVYARQNIAYKIGDFIYKNRITGNDPPQRSNGIIVNPEVISKDSNKTGNYNQKEKPKYRKKENNVNIQVKSETIKIDSLYDSLTFLVKDLNNVKISPNNKTNVDSTKQNILKDSLYISFTKDKFLGDKSPSNINSRNIPCYTARCIEMKELLAYSLWRKNKDLFIEFFGDTCMTNVFNDAKFDSDKVVELFIYETRDIDINNEYTQNPYVLLTEIEDDPYDEPKLVRIKVKFHNKNKYIVVKELKESFQEDPIGKFKKIEYGNVLIK